MTRRSTDCYCHKLAMDRAPGYRYAHIYTSAFPTKLCGEGKPILKIRVTELLANAPADAYWGWWSNEKEVFTHIHPTRSILEMVFPYGSQAEAERGRGDAVPVEIEELETFTAEEAKAKEWRP